MNRRQVLSTTAAGMAVASLAPAVSVGAETQASAPVVDADTVIRHGWRVGTPLAIAMDQLSALLPASIVANAEAGLSGDFGPEEPVKMLAPGVAESDRDAAYSVWRADYARDHGRVLLDVAWLPAARPLWMQTLDTNGRPRRVASPAGLRAYLEMTLGGSAVFVDENMDADARVGTLVPDDLPVMERRVKAVALDGLLPPLTPVWLAVARDAWNSASHREQRHTRAATATAGERLSDSLRLHDRMVRHILEERATIRVVTYS